MTVNVLTKTSAMLKNASTQTIKKTDLIRSTIKKVFSSLDVKNVINLGLLN